MRVKVERLGEGLHPSELLVAVQTRSGLEQIVVDPNSLTDDSLEVGWPVGRDGRYLLIDLPRPTTRGAWRIWVDQNNLIPSEEMRAFA